MYVAISAYFCELERKLLIAPRNQQQNNSQNIQNRN